MKLKAEQIYEIHWFDTEHSIEWISFEKIDEEIEKSEKNVKTIGYFIKETKDSYAFSSGINKSISEYFDLVVIPKKVVTKIKLLK